MSAGESRHVLMIVENLPVPFDRRVWQEARALVSAGHRVSIICPQMKGFLEPREQLEGIEIYRHPLPVQAEGGLGYLLEYGTALFWQMLLALRIFVQGRFHVIHGCNPPDLVFLIALPFRLFGVRYVFDHHDVCPELFEAKFGRRGWLYRAVALLERLNFAAAHYSIATNESYAAVARGRGRMQSSRVTVVRSGPDLSRLRPVAPNAEHRCGKRFLIGYVGVIGAQEGLDLLLESVAVLQQRRQDFHVAVVGGGTSLETIQQLCSSMGLDNLVTFFGRVSDELLLEVLSTADVCVNPDRPSAMNSMSTMNKIMEYMALGKPIVQYDLVEGRFSAGEASLYARNTDPGDFADKIGTIFDDPAMRSRMGDFARERVSKHLSWEHEKVKLLEFYEGVLR